MSIDTRSQATSASLDPNRVRQGKCTTCKVRHEWPVHLTKLADAKCPACGAALKRTTWTVNLPVQQWPRGLGVP